jgi:DNA-binding beta-propeller fold protein YncE
VIKIDPKTNTVVGSFPAGNGSWRIAVDTASNNLYVTDLGSDTIVVTIA